MLEPVKAVIPSPVFDSILQLFIVALDDTM
jgi:hypothetical protein